MIQLNDEKKHIIWIDYARSLAIILVVLCHSTEGYYWDVLCGNSKLSFFLWLIENTMYTLGRIGVPLFLFITGTLMLTKNLSPNDFYKKHFYPLLITTEIWIVIDYIFTCCFSNNILSMKHLIKEMIFLTNADMPQMWYMPMILGVYLAIPYISMFIQKINFKDMLLPLGIIFIICFVLPSVSAFRSNELNSIFNISFLGGTYGLYLIIGYYIGNNKINSKLLNNKKFLILIFLCAFIFNSLLQYFIYIYGRKSISLVWYTSPMILVMAISVFLIIRNTDFRESKINLIVKHISKVSFGIYLIHNLLLNVEVKMFTKYELFNNLNIPLKISVLFLLTLVICTIFFKFISRKSNRINKYLFYIK